MDTVFLSLVVCMLEGIVSAGTSRKSHNPCPSMIETAKNLVRISMMGTLRVMARVNR